MGMFIESLMSDDVYNEFNESSVAVVWRILRKLAITEMLGNRWCPVPFLEINQYYDMFSVYTMKPKKVIDKIKRIIGLPPQLSYIGKLGDILEYPSVKDKETLADISVIMKDMPTVMPDFSFHTKSANDKKDITLTIRGARNYVSYMMFTMSKAYLANINSDRFLMSKSTKNSSSIYVVTNVCAAKSVDLNFSSDLSDARRSRQIWHFDDPVPIAIRLTKFYVGPDREIKGQEQVPVADIFEQSLWDSSKPKAHLQLEECESLKLHLKGGNSNATRQSRSMTRIRYEVSKKN